MFSGIAVDGSNHVYVADFTNSRVEIFTSTGKFLTQWGHYGAKFGELDSPIDVVVSRGRIYVVDHRNNRVEEFSPGGRPTFQWTGLNQPEGLAVDPGGNVYVAADTILKLSPHGRRLA
jgi:DNA-binding beta-propeller fold protein YncE